jgi:integrase
MSRPRKSVPAYRLHKPSGQAVVTVRQADGSRRDVYLGPFDSEESRQAYARAVAGDVPPPPRPATAVVAPPAPHTVNQVLLQFLEEHAVLHYRRPDGTQTEEVAEYRRTIRAVRLLHGNTPAVSFGPKALKAVRQSMVNAGLARGVINQRIGRVVRMFKWAVAEELVPETVHRALATVPGLQAGRTEARETKPVLPVPFDVVQATMPHMQPTVRAMVDVQLLTGARPGEVCAMRGVDLDTSGPLWLYRPGGDLGPTGQHKTAHHGHQRVIVLGPKAQAVLRPFLKADPSAYLFSPAESIRSFRKRQRRNRKSKVQPSQLSRLKPNPRKRPGNRYTVSSYDHAVHAACDRGFPPPAPLARADGETVKEWKARLTPAQEAELRQWQKAHRWHPNQLRHTRGTEVRRHYGLEAAQVILGHQRADVTQVYAERNLELAERVAAEIG